MTPGERRLRLAAARLYLIVTLDAPRRDELAAVRTALRSGAVDLVQLRDLTGDVATTRARARALRGPCADAGVPLLLNDHPALAAALDLDGAHVGLDDMPPTAARAVLGPERLLGASTHDAREVAAMRALPVDHVGLGPCFASGSKDLCTTPGGADLVASSLPAAGGLPVFPIGGITPGNVGVLVAAGARRAAVGAGILGARDPADAARRLQSALRGE